MSDSETYRPAKPNILIVDDDRLILTTLGKGLSDAGYEVREASSGAEALHFCNELLPDLVMLEARMPGLSGMEVAAELSSKNIPFIFLSAYGEHEIVKQAVDHGAYSYLVKPLNITQIVPVIKAALVRSAEVKRLKHAEQNLNVALSQGRASSVAIGLIMERYRLTSEKAFDVLRQFARFQRRRFDEVAVQMVSAAEEINIPPKIIHLVSKAPDKSNN